MAKSIEFPEEQVAEIIRLYVEETQTKKKIANIFYAHESVIDRCLKQNGIEIRHRGKKIDNGSAFGRWITIEEVERKNGRRRFLCECSCKDKTRRNVDLGSLLNGSSQSCGCKTVEIFIQRQNYGWGKLIGKKFGRLTILKILDKNINGRKRCLAQCDCPNKTVKEYSISRIISGVSSSCGCYNKEQRAKSITYQKNDWLFVHPLFCKVEEIIDDPNGLGILTKCKKCDKWFKPKRHQIQRRITAIERPGIFSHGSEMNLYCSDECARSCILYHAHGDPYEIKDGQELPWTSYELNIFSDEVKNRQFIEIGKNKCERCDDEEGPFHTHHVIPKKMEWIYALDPDNGIVVCEKCHYEKMHTGSCSLSELRKLVCPK